MSALVILGFCLFLSVSPAMSGNSTADKLLKKFGTDDKMSEAQTAQMFESIGISEWSYNGSREEHCSSSEYFHRMYSKNDGTVDKTDMADFCPAVLYELSKDACQRAADEEKEEENSGNEEAGKAWGFGILFVTVISVSSLFGVVVVPIMGKNLFQIVLMAMISLAVGVLSGSGIFHLIPHALQLGHKDLSYMFKLVMVAVGIYIFFLLESVMKMYLHFKTIADGNGNEVIPNHGHSHHLPSQPGGISHVPEKYPENVLDEKKLNGVDLSAPGPPKKTIATVAWMIIIGDGLHNFIDGLAIGVSCSTSVLSGLSTSLAIFCEEFPHELGDFAILLNSGMTYKQAMLANFLSACLCYLGLVVGLILGFKTSAVHYIYGIAGGMFLYISLVDMLPESIQMIHNLSGTSKKKAIKMLIIQNFAILLGMGMMLLLSFYAHKIKKAKW